MEEMRALENNGIWDLVSFPRGKTQVRCKWVFTIKHKVDGSVERYKARDPLYGLKHPQEQGDNLKELEKLKGILPKEFDIKDFSRLRYFLDMEVARSRCGIIVFQ
ncbi:hypothetical protein CK203_089321 [Vitis vinifera]|uniref:Reverse transcriptase Ty1/copia-type domain-containing protein n=1 Tax=Vitis vinifera TaxID=29760 RepID=A0A438D2V1_VITVI|nr:hypothetical protein CK203_089321 [Vitis vinifera]